MKYNYALNEYAQSEAYSMQFVLSYKTYEVAAEKV